MCVSVCARVCDSTFALRMHEGEKQMSGSGMAEGKEATASRSSCRRLSLHQISKINGRHLTQILTKLSPLNFWGEEDRSLIELFMSLIILLRGSSPTAGHRGSGMRIFSCGINHQLPGQLCVTGNTKAPELHLTARHRCPELIENF